MFLPIVTLCSVILFGEYVSSQEIEMKEEEKELVNEIASIIADDVIKVNRRLPGAKSKEQESRFLKLSAKRTKDTIEPLLSLLAKHVTDPRNTREHLIELIKAKTAAKALEKVSDDSDIQPRFLKQALNDIVQMSLSFITSVLN